MPHEPPLPFRSNILLIEDDTELALAIAALLDGEGYAVALVRDGIAGLDKALQRDSALIPFDPAEFLARRGAAATHRERESHPRENLSV
jgi:DNA-binding NtrC family response regulator